MDAEDAKFREIALVRNIILMFLNFTSEYQINVSRNEKRGYFYING